MKKKTIQNDKETQINEIDYSNKSIKDLLTNNSFIIVLDTNILLKIYRSSPDYAEFALKCLETVKEYVYIPFNVKWEYEKHRTDEYKKKEKSIENSSKESNALIKDIENRIKGHCNELRKNGYPDIDEMRDYLLDRIDEMSAQVDTYFSGHHDLDFLNKWDSDKVLELVNDFKKMPEPSATFVYKQCLEGAIRYDKHIPPGYKDNKKDGVSKYGDFILWSETINFSVLNKKNIIFVTDDVKEDWWKTLDDGSIQFRDELLKEFSKKTKGIIETQQSMFLMPYIGYEFYQAISKAYGIESIDAMSMVLNATDDFFVERVHSEVFDSVWDAIAYSGTVYLDNDMNVGTEGIDEWELNDCEFIDYERIGIESGVATYVLNYRIKILGTSYDHWGKDYETKDIVTSPGRDHYCNGKVEIQISRNVDTVINWKDDFKYKKALLLDASLSEDYYVDSDSYVYCSQCGKRIGFEWDDYHTDYTGEPICDDCRTTTDEYGFVCSKCGEKYPESMRGGSGTYCTLCEDKYDL